MKIRIVNKRRFITIAVLTVVLITVIGTGIAFYYNMNNPENLFDDIEVNPEENDEIIVNEQFDDSKINILFYGLDKNKYRETEAHYEVYRSDTIMVVTIDLELDTVDVVSIPRDTYATIYNRNGKDKINTAFYYGQIDAPTKDERMDYGVEYLLNTASDVLGNIPINYYIGITDMGVVNEIVDEIGGVEVDVLHTLYADKGKDKSTVEIPAGVQTLNGKQLQYYARYRMYPLGDIDRVANQQHIIKALLDNMKRTNSLVKLPKIYGMVSEKLDTNLSLKQITALSLFGLRLERENLKTYTLPGDFGELGGLSYWIINQSKRTQFLKEVYGIDVAQDKQDPTSDKLVSLSATLSKNVLNVGEKATLSIKGNTANGKTHSYDVNDTEYSISQDGIIQINADNSIVAKSGGSATLTFKVEGITTFTNITVNSPRDTTPPVIKGVKNITITQGTPLTDEMKYGHVVIIEEGGDYSWSAKGNVNVNAVGTYTLTYNAVDEAGNEAIPVSCNVIVVAPKDTTPEEPKESEDVTTTPKESNSPETEGTQETVEP